MQTVTQHTARNPLVNPDPIVHRMVQYQQQDWKGTLFNIVRIITASGKQFFVQEEVEQEQEVVVQFDLRVASGHLWLVTNTRMEAKPCKSHDSSCTICHGVFRFNGTGWKQYSH